MKGNARQSAHENEGDRFSSGPPDRFRNATFIPVQDSRNRRVAGLSTRNGRYYGQIWLERENGTKTARRYALTNKDGTPVTSLTEAKEAHEILRNQRRENALPAPAAQSPKLQDFIPRYLDSPIIAEKKAGTKENEVQALARWKAFAGGIRLHKIDAPTLARYAEQRLKGGIGQLKPASIRTTKLDIIALRNLLSYARQMGMIERLPDSPALPKPTPPPKKRLIADDEFKKLLKDARSPKLKNGQQLADYLQFLAFTGAREKEALAVRWEDVNFDRQVVAIGSGGVSKNRQTREVDFSGSLEKLLRAMSQRRAPDSIWLFPSPQRGKKDIHARTFRETFALVCKAAGIQDIGFHHLRVYFISRAVMAGVDFMTIAAWVGHQDGGVLIGKVYGRLRDDHRRKMAAKLNLGGGA